MQHLYKLVVICLIALAAAQAACVGGAPPKPTLTPERPARTPTVAAGAETATPVPSPSATSNLAPTPLPPPTQIQPPTAAPSSAASQTTPGQPPPGPGITLRPALGEPRDIVLVTGTGWPPGAQVSLHWGPVSGPTGPVYWKVKADANGSFSVGLIVLPAEQWPGGPPKLRDILQLRATSPATDPYYYFANFTYIPRLTPVTAPAASPTITATPTP